MDNLIIYDPLEDKFPMGVVSKNEKVKFCLKNKNLNVYSTFFS